jgi:formate hydrogenlyase subunit 6/NADH:ubiquinone oxidoreductase subunit I
MAWEQGLGEIDVAKIDVSGDFEVLPEFEKPPTFASIDPKFNPYEEIVRIRPTLDEEKCVLCRVCGDESCPADAISFEEFPVIDSKKCISCYCCVEFCPEGALSVAYDKEIFEIV